MEYSCRMREVGYTSTKLLSVHVRIFCQSLWETRSESAHGHCLVGFIFQVRNSRIRCSSAGGYQTALHYCSRPFWIGGELPVYVVRPHASNPECTAYVYRVYIFECTEYVYRDDQDEYVYRATPNIHI